MKSSAYPLSHHASEINPRMSVKHTISIISLSIKAIPEEWRINEQRLGQTHTHTHTSLNTVRSEWITQRKSITESPNPRKKACSWWENNWRNYGISVRSVIPRSFVVSESRGRVLDFRRDESTVNHWRGGGGGEREGCMCIKSLQSLTESQRHLPGYHTLYLLHLFTLFFFWVIL